MYVVVTYNRKWDCIWQVIDKDCNVLARYNTRKEALAELERRTSEQS